MEQTEVEKRLQVVYEKCLQCLRETGILQDVHSKYGIHTAILRALEAGAHSWETRRAVRRANDTFQGEKINAPKGS